MKHGTREEILKAANRVLNRGGLASVTIEAIAVEAGVTKGGVFYYFPNKKELLIAAIDWHEELVYRRRREILAESPGTENHLVRATTQALLDYLDISRDSTHSGIGIMGDPDLRRIFTRMKKRFYDDLTATGADRVQVAMLIYLLDGAWMNNLFSSEIVTGEIRRNTFNLILELADACDRSRGEPAAPPRRRRRGCVMRQYNRNAILDATEVVLARQGFAAATVEAVAVEAQVSKGGLLHYFPNKTALFTACLERFQEDFFALQSEVAKTLPDSPGRLARATVRAIIETRAHTGTTLHYRLDMLDNMEFRKIIGAMRSRTYEDLLRNARRPERILLALYMLDGIWMHRLLDPRPISDETTDHCRDWLRQYIETMLDDYA